VKGANQMKNWLMRKALIYILYRIDSEEGPDVRLGSEIRIKLFRIRRNSRLD
jgi:hypothetical protein